MVVEESLRRRAFDCVRGLLARAFSEFRQIQHGNSGASRPADADDRHVLSAEAEAGAAGPSRPIEAQPFSHDTEVYGSSDLEHLDFLNQHLFYGLSEMYFNDDNLMEDLIQPPADEETQKLSDSGYESNNQGPPGI